MSSSSDSTTTKTLICVTVTIADRVGCPFINDENKRVSPSLSATMSALHGDGTSSDQLIKAGGTLVLSDPSIFLV